MRNVEVFVRDTRISLQKEWLSIVIIEQNDGSYSIYTATRKFSESRHIGSFRFNLIKKKVEWEPNEDLPVMRKKR